MCDQTGCSPDLDEIEPIWSIIKRQVMKQDAKSQNELENADDQALEVYHSMSSNRASARLVRSYQQLMTLYQLLFVL